MTVPRFTSRKFLATVAAVVVSLAAALSGEVAWQEATRQIVAVVFAYLGVEGAADAITRCRTNPNLGPRASR